MSPHAQSEATSLVHFVELRRPSSEYFKSRGLRDQDGLEAVDQPSEIDGTARSGRARGCGSTTRDQRKQGAMRSGSARAHGSATRDQREQRASRFGKERECYDEPGQGNASHLELAVKENRYKNHRQKAHDCHLRMLIN
ncbi:hypothetical protein ACOSP7_021603 [Xanthoceras sorbifolium]